MKKITILLLATWITAAGAALEIHNPEGDTFYFFQSDTLDPQSWSEDSRWYWIFPEESRVIEAAGQYAIGYFGPPSGEEQEVYILDLASYDFDRRITLDLWSGEIVPGYVSPDLMPAFPSVPVILDGNSRDWLTVPALSEFSSNFIPPVYTRESEGDISPFDIAQARDYRQQLPRLLKMKPFQDKLFLFLQKAGQVERDGEFYLYLYENRAQTAPWVIQIPQGQQGPLLLWNTEDRTPLVVGYFYDDGQNLEGELDGRILFRHVKKEGLSLDLTYSREVDSYREEYFLITLYWEDFEYIK